MNPVTFQDTELQLSVEKYHGPTFEAKKEKSRYYTSCSDKHCKAHLIYLNTNVKQHLFWPSFLHCYMKYIIDSHVTHYHVPASLKKKKIIHHVCRSFQRIQGILPTTHNHINEKPVLTLHPGNDMGLLLLVKLLAEGRLAFNGLNRLCLRCNLGPSG